MKKNLFLAIALACIVTSPAFVSCSKELAIEPEEQPLKITDTVTNNSIIGRWLLIQVDLAFGGIVNCSEKNIEYQFFNTGELMVANNNEENEDGIFLTRGEHQYSLNEKASQITIDRLTYQYRIKDKELIIDTGSAWDAPVYVFNLISNDQ